jgi:hypothetical protein
MFQFTVQGRGGLRRRRKHVKLFGGAEFPGRNSKMPLVRFKWKAHLPLRPALTGAEALGRRPTSNLTGSTSAVLVQVQLTLIRIDIISEAP